MKISIKLFYYKIVAPNLDLFSIVLFTAIYCIFLDYFISYYIHLKYEYAYNKRIHIHTWSSTISEKQAWVNISSWLRRLSSSSLPLSTGSLPANSHISGFYKLLVAFIVRFHEDLWTKESGSVIWRTGNILHQINPVSCDPAFGDS